jgi:hypothetical protein
MFKIRECVNCKYDITIYNEVDCERLGKEHSWHDGLEIWENMCCECGRDGEVYLK